MESLAEYGPVWGLVGILIAFNCKLVFEIIKLVQNNTTALQKLSELVSRCSKNQD